MSRPQHVSADTTLQSATPVAPMRGVVACASLNDGRFIPLANAVRIGRAENCELPIDDPSASRIHAVVEPLANGRVRICDLDSRNGTFVDGKQISRCEVATPAIVRVGDTVVRVATFAGYTAATEHGPLVGGSSLAAVRRTIAAVAPVELPVLVVGETGTGKDIVARMLHEASGRHGPLVVIDGGSPPELVAGSAAQAAHGTLFLDEVGELPPAAQAQLLRVLDDMRPRVMDRRAEHSRAAADVRVVSSTNRPSAVRPDVLARLAGVEIRMPALRTRIEDLPALIGHLWMRAQARPVTIGVNALEALAIHDWPGNIRELEHALRAAALVDRDALELESLPDAIRERLRDARRISVPAIKPLPGDARAEIEAALVEHRGNLRRVAGTHGIARGHLYRLLKRWALDPSAYRGGVR